MNETEQTTTAAERGGLIGCEGRIAALLVAETAEAKRRLVGAVESVAEPGRTVLVLHVRDRVSVDRIAARLSCPPSEVSGHLAGGLSQVQSALAHAYGGDSLGKTIALLQVAMQPHQATHECGVET